MTYVVENISMSPMPMIKTSKAAMSSDSEESHDPQVLVVTESPTLRRHVTRALVSIGCDVRPYQSGELPESELQSRRDMYLIDVDVRENIELVQRIQQAFPDAIVLALSRNLQNPDLHDLLAGQTVSNLIARHGISATQEMIDEVELITTSHKLFTGDVFGIEKYLSVHGVRIHHHQIRGTNERLAALEQFHEFLNRLQVHNSLIPRIKTVADELLMNAIFSAPRDASWNSKYETRDRSESLVLEPSERVHLRYACDGRHVVVAVSDSFGKLDRETILRYLDAHFHGERSEMERKAGGAGLGFSMVFGSVTQLVFNVKPCECTEVIALFYVRSGPKAFSVSGRSLNIFTVP